MTRSRITVADKSHIPDMWPQCAAMAADPLRTVSVATELLQITPDLSIKKQTNSDKETT